MTESHFTSKAPKRLPAVLWAIAMMLLPAPAVLTGAWWCWLLMIPCAGIAGVLLLSIPFPALFLWGVRRYPGGFEIRMPFRRPKCIEYRSITHICAVVQRDRDMGFTLIDLIIRTPSDRVRIPDELVLQQTELHSELQSLPGFDAEAYEIAKLYEPFGLTDAFPKRFKVLGV